MASITMKHASSDNNNNLEDINSYFHFNGNSFCGGEDVIVLEKSQVPGSRQRGHPISGPSTSRTLVEEAQVSVLASFRAGNGWED